MIHGTPRQWLDRFGWDPIVDMDDSAFRRPLTAKMLGHDRTQRDNPIGPGVDLAGKRPEYARRNPAGPDGPKDLCGVRPEVHHPEHQTRTPEPLDICPDGPDEGGSGEGKTGVETPQSNAPLGGQCVKGPPITEPVQRRRPTSTQRADPVNAQPALPDEIGGFDDPSAAVQPAGADHVDLMPGGGEGLRDVRKQLAGCRRVGGKELIQEEDSHRSLTWASP